MITLFCGSIAGGAASSCSMILGSCGRGRIAVPDQLLGEQADRVGRLVEIDNWFLTPFLGCGIDQSKAAGVDNGAILAGEHLTFKGEDTRSLPP